MPWHACFLMYELYVHVKLQFYLMQVLDIPIVLATIPSFHLKFLQVHRSFNESAEFSFHLKTIEIPFYISEGFLYFNASKANEIGVDDKYHVVITTNGTEPGMVGMVLTTVSVERGGRSVLCLYLYPILYITYYSIHTYIYIIEWLKDQILWQS